MFLPKLSVKRKNNPKKDWEPKDVAAISNLRQPNLEKFN